MRPPLALAETPLGSTNSLLHSELLMTAPILSISTFLAPLLAVNRKENGMRRWAGRLVAVLLLVPLGAVSAQRLARPLEDRALRPGDVLRINVWRHPELSGDFVVAPDSTLVDPVYQVVKVAGAPLAVVRERVRAVLSTYEACVPFVLEPVFPVTVEIGRASCRGRGSPGA